MLEACWCCFAAPPFLRQRSGAQSRCRAALWLLRSRWAAPSIGYAMCTTTECHRESCSGSRPSTTRVVTGQPSDLDMWRRLEFQSGRWRGIDVAGCRGPPTLRHDALERVAPSLVVPDSPPTSVLHSFCVARGSGVSELQHNCLSSVSGRTQCRCHSVGATPRLNARSAVGREATA